MFCKLKDLNERGIIPESFSNIKSPYPIGSVYLSMSSTNPSELFGGRWLQIKDAFLFAANNETGTCIEGGEAEVILTEKELPSHTHDVIATENTTTSSVGAHAHSITMYYVTSNFKSGSKGSMLHRSKGSGTSMGSNAVGNHTHTLPQHSHTVSSESSGTSHNNMPPYLVVYAWRRVA